MAKDLTIEILKQIRDGIADLKAGQDATNQRLDATNERLDGAIQRLDRVEQGLLDLGKFMRELAVTFAAYERFHTHHVEILEGSMQDLRDRVVRLENRASQ